MDNQSVNYNETQEEFDYVTYEIEDDNECKNEICPVCGTFIDKDDAFCLECGASLKKQSEFCGNLIDADCSFCTECGEKISNELEIVIPDTGAPKECFIVGVCKDKKKIFFIVGLIVVIVIVIISVISLNTSTPAESDNSAKYEEENRKEEEKRKKVLDYAISAENYIVEIRSIYDDLYDVNRAWDKANDFTHEGFWYNIARKNFSSEISRIRNSKERLDNMYNISEIENIDDPYAKEIAQKHKEIKENFDVLYDDVIVDESGYNSNDISNLYTLVDEFEELITEVKNEYN